MKDLIERLEKATGPSYELSQDIGRALGLRQRYEHPGSENLSWPHYTYSLDAALTLVPEGHDWIVASVNGQVGGTPYACCGSETAHYGETPVLSLCIAALKARAAVERDLTKMEASNG
jgi:hypothetical protein